MRSTAITGQGWATSAGRANRGLKPALKVGAVLASLGGYLMENGGIPLAHSILALVLVPLLTDVSVA